MAGIRFRLREVFGLDLRSLAVLRSGLGIAVLLIVASYARDFRDLFGEHAVISVPVAYAMAGPEVDPYMAPFWILPGFGEWVLPIALTALGLALTLGFYTRIACAGCWYALYCLQVRNPFAGNFSDDIVLRMLFWSIFLPLGARFSIDAQRASAPKRFASPYVSVASAALLIQVASIYFVAGFKKIGPDWQQDLTALWYVAQNHFRGTSLSGLLLAVPSLMKLATWITPRFEVAIGLALFVPFAAAAVRTVSVGLIIGFHLMLSLFIFIGAAPFVCGVAALGLLPGVVWDRLGVGRGDAAASAASVVPPGSRGRRGLRVAAQLLLSVPVSVMLLYDLMEVSYTKQLQPRIVHWLGETLRVTQQWDMFSPSPAHFDGWFIAPGVLANGDVIDLTRDGAAIRTEPPEELPWIGDDYRMSYFHEAVRNQVEALGTDYGRWLCRAWNRDHAGDERLVRLEFVWMNVDLSHGVREDPRRIWLIRRHCDPSSD